MIDVIKAFFEFFLDLFSAISAFIGSDFNMDGLMEIFDVIPAETK